MAEGDVVLYNDFFYQLGLGVHDFSGHTIKAALLAGHTPDKDNDAQWSDVSSDEESGTGYTAGGVTITATWSKDSATDNITLDFSNPTWAGLDVGTPSHLEIYNDTAANKNLIGYIELGRPSNGGNYTVEINAAGLFYLDN